MVPVSVEPENVRVLRVLWLAGITITLVPLESSTGARVGYKPIGPSTHKAVNASYVLSLSQLYSLVLRTITIWSFVLKDGSVPVANFNAGTVMCEVYTEFSDLRQFTVVEGLVVKRDCQAISKVGISFFPTS